MANPQAGRVSRFNTVHPPTCPNCRAMFQTQEGLTKHELYGHAVCGERANSLGLTRPAEPSTSPDEMRDDLLDLLTELDNDR